MNQSHAHRPPEKLACPACGNLAGVPLAWGTPDKETWEASLRGELVIAVCVIQPNGGAVPDYACLHCSHRWVLG